jgi:hypothetical protein
LGKAEYKYNPNEGNAIRQECRLKSHQRQTVILTARLGVETVSTFTRSVSAHEFMDATPYGHSLLISAKPCSHVACTCSWTRTAQPRATDLRSCIGTRWMIHSETRNGKAGPMIDQNNVYPPNGIDGVEISEFLSRRFPVLSWRFVVVQVVSTQHIISPHHITVSVWVPHPTK